MDPVMRAVLRALVAASAVACAVDVPAQDEARVVILRDPQDRELTVRIDGADALTYRHGKEFAIPHFFPVLSPSGRALTVQHPDPYPHHRSLWIADAVQLGDGPAVDFYHCWKNLADPEKPEAGYVHFIRHEAFEKLETRDDRAEVTARLRWIVDRKTPVLDELRSFRVVALDDGEYLVDLSWKLTASHGDVVFRSDWVHYAWPYVRMHPDFSGDKGGVLVDDRGRKGQKGTNEKHALWVDCSNRVDGVTEGMALFVFPDGGSHKWLTREYGCFGPRRADELSGTKFTLKKGESLPGRVGILVHRGDADSGRVAERYRQYVEGEL